MYMKYFSNFNFLLSAVMMQQLVVHKAYCSAPTV